MCVGTYFGMMKTLFLLLLLSVSCLCSPVVVSNDRIYHGMFCTPCHDLIKAAYNAGAAYNGVPWLDSEKDVVCDVSSLLKHYCEKEIEKHASELDQKIKAKKSAVDACAEVDFC